MSVIPEKVRIVEKRVFDIFTLSLREDGILHRHISNQRDSSHESVQELTTVIGELVNYRSVPVMITIDDFVNPPPAILINQAKKNSRPYSKADAYISKSLAHKLVIEFYIKNYKPERPTRLFENEEEAVEWLKTFL